MTPTTERLVFPRPASPRVRRIVLAAVLVAYAIMLGVSIRFHDLDVVIAMLLSTGPVSWMNARQGTRVTTESITVRGPIRTRTLPLADVTEIVHPGRFGRHVLITPKTGYKWQLPRVRAEDVDDIHALTGLPVRVSQQPE